MDILEIALRVFDEIESEVKHTSKWNETSKYVRIRKLQIDKRGSFGERLLRDIFSKERNISLEYRDGDQGSWDIKINGIKLEVKTSSLDVNNKFQNEHIAKNSDCDYIIFIGIAPDDVYLRIEKLSQIDFSKLHNREERKTGAGYKWDFKPNEMAKIQTSDEVVKIIYDKIGLDKKKIKKLLKANDK